MKTVKPLFLLSILAVTGACDSDLIESDFCPDDPAKVAPGMCGCGVPDVLENGQINYSCLDIPVETDLCPDDPEKIVPGFCGCGAPDYDEEGALRLECAGGGDLCPYDDEKTAPGICGCGISDDDTDDDGIPDCMDICYEDPEKVQPGICGCGKGDTLENIVDTDGDTVIDCLDECPLNPDKSSPEDIGPGCDLKDSDKDGVTDSDDVCPYNPNYQTVLEEGEDCNYVDTEEGRVFQIWSAGDLKRLREELEKTALTDPLNMLCELSNQATVCIDEHHRLDCTLDTSTWLYTWQLSGCTSCAAAEIPGPNEGDLPTLGDVVCKNDPAGSTAETVALYQSCAETMKPICVKGGENGPDVQMYCENSLVAQKTCYGGCDAATNTCVTCKGEITEDGTIENQCCNPDVYKETCSGGSAMRCIDGRVQKVSCLGGCESSDTDSRHVRCINADPIPEPRLIVRLMNDIDLTTAFTVRDYFEDCLVSWTPISLYGVTFDGGGANGKPKTISATSAVSGRVCSLRQPLFESVVDSRVTKLNLRYNLIGRPSAPLATFVHHSEIDSVVWDADAVITKPVQGEYYDGFGGLVSVAQKSLFKNVGVAGTIRIESTAFQAAGFIHYADQVRIEDATISPRIFQCSAQPCSGVFNELVNSQVIGMKTDFDAFGYGVSEGIITGFADNISPDSEIRGLSHHIGGLSQIYGSKSDFYGVTKTIQSQFSNLSVRIDGSAGHTEDAEGALYGAFYGVAQTIEGKLDKLTVNIGELTGNSAMYGVGDIGASATLNNCSITVGSLESSLKAANIDEEDTVDGIGSKIGGFLDKCTIEIGSVTGDIASGLCYDTLTGGMPVITNSEITVKSVKGTKRANGFARYAMLWLNDNTINVGSVQSEGDAYGLGNVFNMSPALDRPVGDSDESIAMPASRNNTVSIGTVKGLAAFGLTDTGTADHIDNTYAIEAVEAGMDAYGVARDLSGARINSSFEIGKVSSDAGNAYGIAQSFGGSSAESEKSRGSKTTFTIHELESANGNVFCTANNNASSGDIIEIGTVNAVGDVCGLFGAPSGEPAKIMVTAADQTLHVKSAESQKGSIYLLGNSLISGAEPLSLMSMDVLFDHAKGVQVMPVSQISTSAAVTLKDIAIYANGQFTQTVPEGTETPAPAAIFFADAVTAKPELIKLDNIVVSSRMQHCTGEKADECVLPESVSFIRTPSPAEMPMTNAFVVPRKDEFERFDPKMPYLKAIIDAATLEDAMVNLGDAWTTRKIAEDDAVIEVPWLKRESAK